jgi:hypothetical protein
MTITQAHKEFQLFMDKVDSQGLPDFLPTEIDVFIHEAELRLVKQAYGGNNIYKTGFGSSQKRMDDISPLIKTTILPITNNLVILPSDYMFLDRVVVEVSSSKVSKTYVTPFLCPHDKLSITLNDPFNKSTIGYPIIWQEGKNLHIDTPDFTAHNIKLTYIKYPNRVSKVTSISSELPEQKQREAIQMAVRIALGVIESPRVQEQNDQLGTLE